MYLRGWKIDKELKEKIFNIEKNILKDNLEIKDLHKYNFLYNYPQEIVKAFQLFNKLKEYNIDYKIYIIIFFSLSENNIKNLLNLNGQFNILRHHNHLRRLQQSRFQLLRSLSRVLPCLLWLQKIHLLPYLHRHTSGRKLAWHT